MTYVATHEYIGVSKRNETRTIISLLELLMLIDEFLEVSWFNLNYRWLIIIIYD